MLFLGDNSQEYGSPPLQSYLEGYRLYGLPMVQNAQFVSHKRHPYNNFMEFIGDHNLSSEAANAVNISFATYY